MESADQRVELLVTRKRVAASQFEAECAGIVGWGPTPAAALSACVAALCKSDDLQGLYWRDAETGVAGMIARPRKKRAPKGDKNKGAVFDLLGGKMNDFQRMKDEGPIHTPMGFSE